MRALFQVRSVLILFTLNILNIDAVKLTLMHVVNRLIFCLILNIALRRILTPDFFKIVYLVNYVAVTSYIRFIKRGSVLIESALLI